MLNVEVLPELRETFQVFHFHEALFGNEVWWFQDGAPCPRSLAVRQLLTQKFENRLVSLTGWPQLFEEGNASFFQD